MKDYIKKAIRTESSNFEEIRGRMSSDKMTRIIHASMGINTENGELQDQLKKHFFYGKQLDEVNLKEELGDLFWYCAILADALGTTFEKEMERNIEKLTSRYPEKFTKDDAINRNLNNEREILEK